jgi:hypothetical protein
LFKTLGSFAKYSNWLPASTAVANCPNGKLLLEVDSIESLLRILRAPGFLRQDMWQALFQALICQKAHVYFYSENLTDEQIRGILLRPCHNIESTVNDLLNEYGRDTSICVLPEGPQTIPYFHEAGH